jgi:hypothetical protein
MQHIFYYDTTEIMRTIQNSSHYREDGQEKNFTDLSIGNDDYPALKKLLKRTCSKVFMKIHSLTKEVVGKAYYFDEEIIGEEETSLGENLIGFVLVFPDNFNLNLVDAIDEAISEAIIKSTFNLWLEYKGRKAQDVNEESREAFANLKEAINFRDSMSIDYNRY